MARIVHMAPRVMMMSNGPPRKMWPTNVEMSMAAAVAMVFNMASAYFRHAATNKPPAADMTATITVTYDQPEKGVRVVCTDSLLKVLKVKTKTMKMML